jgi:putative acetyltransferase
VATPQRWRHNDSMQNTAVIVRRATADDAAAIALVHAAAIRGLASTHYEPAQISAWSADKQPDRYRRALAAGERMFVATVNGSVIGFAACQDDEVRAVYVDPRYIRRGIGTRLLATVEDEALARGARVLRLEASLNAVAFYSLRGYKECGRATHPLRGGEHLDCVLMTKILA